MDQLQPKKTDLASPAFLRIEWQDGSVSALLARELRLACPCAICVDEHTGAALLDPSTVPANITIQDVEPVGRYGLSFRWSDGHRTGIFSWPRLKEIGEAGRSA